MIDMVEQSNIDGRWDLLCLKCGKRHQGGVVAELIHPCCGCSCHICADGHRAGKHIQECWARMLIAEKQIELL